MAGAGNHRSDTSLRKLDRLLEERFAQVLGRHGVSRRQWQLLNALADGGHSPAALAAAMAPFLDPAAGETVERHLDPLTGHGFVHDDGGVLALTGAGRALLERLAAEVQTVRALLVEGLGEQRYDQTVAGLQAMIRNLEPVGQGSAKAGA